MSPYWVRLTQKKIEASRETDFRGIYRLEFPLHDIWSISTSTHTLIQTHSRQVALRKLNILSEHAGSTQRSSLKKEALVIIIAVSFMTVDPLNEQPTDHFLTTFSDVLLSQLKQYYYFIFYYGFGNTLQ